MSSNSNTNKKKDDPKHKYHYLTEMSSMPNFFNAIAWMDMNMKMDSTDMVSIPKSNGVYPPVVSNIRQLEVAYSKIPNKYIYTTRDETKLIHIYKYKVRVKPYSRK